MATIIETEFAGGSEKFVHIASEELFHRCQASPHLRWVRMNGVKEEDVAEVGPVQLDNDGNAFVIALGDASCAEGPSLIEADLLSKPFTTFMTDFTIEPPQPPESRRNPRESRHSRSKSANRSSGSASGFSTSPLTGSIGQTVDYQIVVKNTGNEALTFSNFIDGHCDPGTIVRRPGGTPVAPGASTTYTCTHVLPSAGSYVNEASVTGTLRANRRLPRTSNRVEVTVPAATRRRPARPRRLQVASVPRARTPRTEKCLADARRAGRSCTDASGPEAHPIHAQGHLQRDQADHASTSTGAS